MLMFLFCFDVISPIEYNNLKVQIELAFKFNFVYCLMSSIATILLNVTFDLFILNESVHSLFESYD